MKSPGLYGDFRHLRPQEAFRHFDDRESALGAVFLSSSRAPNIATLCLTYLA